MPKVKRPRLCAQCDQLAYLHGGYCLTHHAAYMREWRKTHPLKGEARLKANARSYANVYIRRGKIERLPCEVCGEVAKAHLDDYTKPLQIRWLCRKHNRQ